MAKLDPEFREAVKETCRLIADEMLTKPMKLTVNEKLIQGGITVIALMVIAVVVSAACWGIAIIWNNIL